MPRRVLPDTHTRITAENERKLKRRMAAPSGDSYGPWYDPTQAQALYWTGTSFGFDYNLDGYYFTHGTAGTDQIQLPTLNTFGTAIEYVEGGDGGMVHMNVDGLYAVEFYIQNSSEDIAPGDRAGCGAVGGGGEVYGGWPGYGGTTEVLLGGTYPPYEAFRSWACVFKAGAEFEFHVSNAEVNTPVDMFFSVSVMLLGVGTVL